ncbi:NAD(P)/FAD-dependent oxidoreductase [Lutibaculum baratangense]|uniref:Amine oxidase, flavin-containing n=1 Tax=Lutibaculum baratangense AMV1 TaxID=631454 RepID=V4RRG0_9HYPH|nr:FAD-dependent oxidoreductase [Lutibaculum baratangense]ESR25730.1 Amine oxidase, flavin-containing [Lutibaculum baratangense AMV1]
MRVAVIGSGISGLSAAWLLSRSVRVTLFEQEGRFGGHSNTLEVATRDGGVAVDTGFIVYNEPSYPNLSALFRHLDVETEPSEMSFAVSFGGGAYEYAGSLGAFFGQWGNLTRPEHWTLLFDILRFFREGREREPADEAQTLGEYLTARGFSERFVDRHLLPMGAAIWSTPVARMLDYPAAAFLRFFDNHGLLKLVGRPVWRTVSGGSREYVRRVLEDVRIERRAGTPVVRVWRAGGLAHVADASGHVSAFDQVVLACHADQALRLLADPSPLESELLGSFGYSLNRAHLHGDASFMPRRRRVWASWNYVTDQEHHHAETCVTYWMNRLQRLPTRENLFVTLNPVREPERVHAVVDYHHPVFDAAAVAARRGLWDLQGVNHTWFCGSYFGDGFHEDGIQSGLAVAEELGGARRPWRVDNESGRIHTGPRHGVGLAEAAE